MKTHNSNESEKQHHTLPIVSDFKKFHHNRSNDDQKDRKRPSLQNPDQIEDDRRSKKVPIDDDSDAALEGYSNGRERLKRYRVEVAGHVWIPEIWGQEELLKEWIDCSAFDASLGKNTNIMSARMALVEGGRQAASRTLRVENRC